MTSRLGVDQRGSLSPRGQGMGMNAGRARVRHRPHSRAYRELWTRVAERGEGWPRERLSFVSPGSFRGGDKGQKG